MLPLNNDTNFSLFGTFKMGDFGGTLYLLIVVREYNKMKIHLGFNVTIEIKNLSRLSGWLRHTINCSVTQSRC